MKSRRNGLTLVELVVVSGMGSILLGLALPAIQGGKEEANRLECLDNLRNIAMASHVYDDVNGELPPFMGLPGNPNDCFEVFPNAGNYQLTYSLVQLLEFTGHADLVELTDPFAFSSKNATIQDFGYTTFADWINGIDEAMPGISNIAFDVQISEFRCPSDADAPTNTILFGPHPSNSACIATSIFPPDRNVYSITNYVSNAGAIGVTTTPSPAIGWVGYHGPIRSRESDSVDSIVDGASNVVLFAESLGNIDPLSGSLANIRYSMAMGGISVGRPDLYPSVDKVFGDTTDSSWIQFGSAHPEVVNVVRADGSAHSVNRNIDSRNFGRLCGVADGLPFFDFDNN